MQRAKETASDVAASAKSGMEKAKAMAEEKGEKWTTRDPVRKEMAEEKRDERVLEAEREKQAAYDQNAASRQAHGGYGYTTGGGDIQLKGQGGRTTPLGQLGALLGPTTLLGSTLGVEGAAFWTLLSGAAGGMTMMTGLECKTLGGYWGW